jgi:hypothetical protein
MSTAVDAAGIAEQFTHNVMQRDKRTNNMFHLKQITVIASLVIVAAAAGFVSGRGSAAGAVDPLQLAANGRTGVGIYSSSGETPEAMQREAALNISAYEPESMEGGEGAPQKTLIDNDKVKVILVAYKKGFIRPGGLKRRYDTLLVYVDPGRYTITKTGANTSVKKEIPDKLAPGSSVFHRKDSIVSELRVDQDYRVLYVEMK